MVLDILISCDDLIFQRVLGPFDLNLNSNRRAQERCLMNCSICNCAPLNLKLGIAFSFPLPRVLKTSHHFCHHQKWGHSSKCFEFQKWLHILVVVKMSKPILEIEEY